MLDRHVRTKQKPRSIKQAIDDLKARLAVETIPYERAYLKQMIADYEKRVAK